MTTTYSDHAGPGVLEASKERRDKLLGLVRIRADTARALAHRMQRAGESWYSYDRCLSDLNHLARFGLVRSLGHPKVWEARDGAPAPPTIDSLVRERGELAEALNRIYEAADHSDTLLWSAVRGLQDDPRFTRETLEAHAAEAMRRSAGKNRHHDTNDTTGVHP